MINTNPARRKEGYVAEETSSVASSSSHSATQSSPPLPRHIIILWNPNAIIVLIIPSNARLDNSPNFQRVAAHSTSLNRQASFHKSRSSNHDSIPRVGLDDDNLSIFEVTKLLLIVFAVSKLYRAIDCQTWIHDGQTADGFGRVLGRFGRTPRNEREVSSI
jgi:hypothetical protein